LCTQLKQIQSTSILMDFFSHSFFPFSFQQQFSFQPLLSRLALLPTPIRRMGGVGGLVANGNPFTWSTFDFLFDTVVVVVVVCMINEQQNGMDDFLYIYKSNTLYQSKNHRRTPTPTHPHLIWQMESFFVELFYVVHLE